VERSSREIVVAYFKILYRSLHGETEDDYDKIRNDHLNTSHHWVGNGIQNFSTKEYKQLYRHLFQSNGSMGHNLFREIHVIFRNRVDSSH
jgi:hypothetical protein